MSGNAESEGSEKGLLRMAADIVSAYVRNNPLPAGEVPGVIRSIYTTLSEIEHPGAASAAGKPAVPVRRSVTPDYLICLEDGKRLKMLKRHLRADHGLSPEQYRAKWSLAPDYPMVAPNYGKQRSEFAKKIGLGRRRTRRRSRAR